MVVLPVMVEGCKGTVVTDRVPVFPVEIVLLHPKPVVPLCNLVIVITVAPVAARVAVVNVPVPAVVTVIAAVAPVRAFGADRL